MAAMAPSPIHPSSEARPGALSLSGLALAQSALAGLEREDRVVSVPSFEQVLPDGGLPRGAVVEFACPRSLGQATSLALRACASAQREALLRGGEPAWCAWLDPQETLYAPGVAAHGVVLDRLLVVHPPHDALARIAVRMVASRVFSVLIIDTLGVPCGVSSKGVSSKQGEISLRRWHNVVRRFAIAARDGDTSVVLLTEQESARTVGLPVAMRVELEQPEDGRLRMKVAKERRGRIGMPSELAYTRPAHQRAMRSA